ncbi:MAG: 30S ribosomal protein S16 [Longimicrobiales bacterium]
MPARIRLRRMGRKKKPHYRVVVADSASPRDGRFVETLGYYKPLSDPARLVIDLERVDHWISEGASPSGTVKSLIAKARRGGDDIVAVGVEDPEEAKVKRAEQLAAKRAAEAKAAADKAAEAEAAAKAAEEAAAAEAEAEKAAEAEATEAAEDVTEAEEEATEEEAAAEAEEAPAAEAEDAEGADEEEEKSE